MYKYVVICTRTYERTHKHKQTHAHTHTCACECAYVHVYFHSSWLEKVSPICGGKFEKEKDKASTEHQDMEMGKGSREGFYLHSHNEQLR